MEFLSGWGSILCNRGVSSSGVFQLVRADPVSISTHVTGTDAGSNPVLSTMNFEDYKKRLNKHDWYYSMSDDPRVYESGLAEESKLKMLAARNKSFQKAYDTKRNALFAIKK